jgi:hypothetical protein
MGELQENIKIAYADIPIISEKNPIGIQILS